MVGCHGASAAATVHRIAGRQYTECEKVHSAGQTRNLNLKPEYGAINRGDMYEIRVSQGKHPLPVF